MAASNSSAGCRAQVLMRREAGAPSSRNQQQARWPVALTGQPRPSLCEHHCNQQLWRGAACSIGSLRGGKAPALAACPSWIAAAAAATAAAEAPARLAGAACMEEVYDQLADRVMQQLTERGSSDAPWLVGVAGVPGSGKSSLVRSVCARLNARGAPTVVVPMDGFHYFRRQLDQMPDPELAHARRGAEWTFDARAYHDCLADIKRTGEGQAPSFDHGVGDPRPADIRVERHHRVVLSEGNYLLLPAEPWWRLGELFDDTWYIDCCLEEAMGRVFARQTGNGLAEETSRWRVAANDRPNAEQIETTRGRAALLVPGQLPLTL